MSASNAIVISIHLGKRDGDILKIASQFKLQEMILLAARNYLGKTDNKIPVPPQDTCSAPSWYKIVITKEADPDVYALFSKIQDGYRSHAVKLMLRHAMERCDLCVLRDTPAPGAKARNKSAKPPEPRVSQPQEQHIQQAAAMPPRFVPESQNPTDDIFDLI